VLLHIPQHSPPPFVYLHRYWLVNHLRAPSLPLHSPSLHCKANQGRHHGGSFLHKPDGCLTRLCTWAAIPQDPDQRIHFLLSARQAFPLSHLGLGPLLHQEQRLLYSLARRPNLLPNGYPLEQKSTTFHVATQIPEYCRRERPANERSGSRLAEQGPGLPGLVPLRPSCCDTTCGHQQGKCRRLQESAEGSTRKRDLLKLNTLSLSFQNALLSLKEAGQSRKS
jgi:hypothetical protein